MLSSLLKKKLSANQFANIFINAVFEATENGFEVISDMINNDPAFVTSPNIQKEDFQKFQLIILAANFNNLDKYFEISEMEDIKTTIIEKLSTIFNVETKTILDVINHYYGFIGKVNHPSKTLLYGISKAVFFKYDLKDFQDEYFRRMQAPNPLFLKRLDAIMENFLWDWSTFTKRYRF